MIGALASLVAGLGIPQRLARIAAIALLVVALLLALWVAKQIYDRNLVARHVATDAVVQSQADRAADAQVATQRRADDARLRVEAQELERVTADEMDATLEISDARRRYYDCVRVQQQARARGDLTPAC